MCVFCVVLYVCGVYFMDVECMHALRRGWSWGEGIFLVHPPSHLRYCRSSINIPGRKGVSDL